MSKIEVDNIDTVTGTTELTIGGTNATSITLGSGASFSNVSGQNYPAFEAEVGSTQTLTSGATTLIEFDTEIFDTDGMYDNSAGNYKFTPTVAGKYFVYARTYLDTGGTTTGYRYRIFIYKNGSLYANSASQFVNGTNSNFNQHIFSTIDMNGSTDYLQMYVYHQVYSGGTPTIFQDTGRNAFGAYRIGS